MNDHNRLSAVTGNSLDEAISIVEEKEVVPIISLEGEGGNED